MAGNLPLFSQCPVTGQTLDIDRFDIVPANPDECPPPGTAINGDLEAMGGWMVTGSSANGNPFSASIEPNIGEASSRAIRLFARNRCSNLRAHNQVSIPGPDVVASPALSFYNKTSATLPGIQTYSRLAEIALPMISASGSALTQRVCLPAFTRGGMLAFEAGMNIDGVCAEQANGESIIDSLKVFNDPSCGTNTSITDPGFESSLALIGATAQPGRSLSRIIVDPALAHAGNGALQLSVTQLCTTTSWVANVVVPPVDGTRGPAVTFFYKAPPAGNYMFRARAGAGAGFTPTLDNTYRQGKLCLDPRLAGRNQVVTFAMEGGGGTCATTHPAETAYVDDLDVTTDPDCPTM